MKFSIKDFFSKCDHILRKLRICSLLLRQSLTENFIFCAVYSRKNRDLFRTVPNIEYARFFFFNKHIKNQGLGSDMIKATQNIGWKYAYMNGMIWNSNQKTNLFYQISFQ